MTNKVFRNDRTLATSLINPLTDCLLTINGSDPDTFDMSEGFGLFVDSFTNPNLPDAVPKFIPSQTAVTIDRLLTGIVTFVYIDINGAIVQEGTLQGNDFLRDHIAVGIIDHVTTTITAISSPTQVSNISAQMGFADSSTATGPIIATQGGRSVVTGRSGTLNVNKSVGNWYYHALNARNTNKDPNNVLSPAITDGTIVVSAWRSTGTPGGLKAVIQKDILLLFDDGTAVDADALPQGTLGAEDWVNHRLWEPVNEAASGNTPILLLQLGQQKYPSKFAAIHGMASEDIEIFDVFKGAGVIATITVRGGSTDFSDPCDFDMRAASGGRSDHK